MTSGSSSFPIAPRIDVFRRWPQRQGTRPPRTTLLIACRDTNDRKTGEAVKRQR